MTLREPFRPLRPDLDGFLFAQVGNETNGVPLSVISALTRLGLDPWEEAGRLSSFGDREAAEQLARLIADLPGHAFRLPDARTIASGLVSLLPRGESAPWAPQKRIRRGFRLQLRIQRGFWLQMRIRSRFWPPAFPTPSQFWIVCLLIAGAVLLGAVIHHGFPFGIGNL